MWRIETSVFNKSSGVSRLVGQEFPKLVGTSNSLSKFSKTTFDCFCAVWKREQGKKQFYCIAITFLFRPVRHSSITAKAARLERGLAWAPLRYILFLYFWFRRPKTGLGGCTMSKIVTGRRSVKNNVGQVIHPVDSFKLEPGETFCRPGDGAMKGTLLEWPTSLHHTLVHLFISHSEAQTQQRWILSENYFFHHSFVFYWCLELRFPFLVRFHIHFV